MNYYQFESEEMDRQFLLREPVQCPAIMPAEKLSELKSGDKIVVRLFNRSKYMGVITSIEFSVKNEVAKGYFKIIKH